MKTYQRKIKPTHRCMECMRLYYRVSKKKLIPYFCKITDRRTKLVRIK